MSERRIITWDQGTLGGGWVRYHMETRIIDGIAHKMSWECEQPDTCDMCHEHKESDESHTV